MRWIAAVLLAVELLTSSGCTAYDALFGVYSKGHSNGADDRERQESLQAQADRWQSDRDNRLR